jgi:hypothetical protein
MFAGLLLAFATAAMAQGPATHEIIIDGVTQDLRLAEPATVTLPDGRTLKLEVKRKSVLVFSADGATFEHPGFMSVNSSVKEDGMVQHMAVSAIGSLLLVQAHDDIDLQALLDEVYTRMVEEPLALGLEVKKEDFTRTLASGQTIKGYQATYKSDDDDVTLEMLIHRGKNKSYLMMSMHDAASAPAEKPAIDRFWQTLSLQ